MTKLQKQNTLDIDQLPQNQKKNKQIQDISKKRKIQAKEQDHKKGKKVKTLEYRLQSGLELTQN